MNSQYLQLKLQYCEKAPYGAVKSHRSAAIIKAFFPQWEFFDGWRLRSHWYSSCPVFSLRLRYSPPPDAWSAWPAVMLVLLLSVFVTYFFYHFTLSRLPSILSTPTYSGPPGTTDSFSVRGEVMYGRSPAASVFSSSLESIMLVASVFPLIFLACLTFDSSFVIEILSVSFTIMKDEPKIKVQSRSAIVWDNFANSESREQLTCPWFVSTTTKALFLKTVFFFFFQNLKSLFTRTLRRKLSH